jgi:hypothetical protein
VNTHYTAPYSANLEHTVAVHGAAPQPPRYQLCSADAASGSRGSGSSGVDFDDADADRMGASLLHACAALSLERRLVSLVPRCESCAITNTSF